MTTIELTSPAFTDGGAIPMRFTCEGEGISPPLAWSAPPDGTRSMALIVDDPDAPDPAAPQRVFVHWLVYGIPPSARELPEGSQSDVLPVGARAGLNDGERVGWAPPCPPTGRHRYFFRLYALDVAVEALEDQSRAGVESAMKGHILGQGVLMGTYEKKK
jgi:Raf kinase inhibitor-like YbhB/YbcL family protein